MTIVKLVKDRWLNVLPLIISGIVYLADNIFIYSHKYSLCNISSFDCQTLLEFYGEPFWELATIIIPTGIIALFITNRLYKYWLAVFGVWFFVTLLWMLSISDPRGAWENHRSAVADLSGAALFLVTLVWLSMYYFLAKRNKK
jgi:hypothetical protein